MQIKAWKPTFAKVRSLAHLKSKEVEPIYPVPETLREKYIEAEVVEPEVVEPERSFQTILPELWQPWMARQILEHEITKDHMDYLEAMERRDKVTEALIVLRSEAAQLKMEHTLSLISDAGAAILDELWKKGGLGD
jgi:hypothetical protein